MRLMKPRTLSLDTPILDLATEILHTRSLLQAYPFLQEHVARFDGLYAEWTALMQQELGFLSDKQDGEAQVIAVDDAIDYLCVAISATLLAEAGGDRKATSYQRYFGAAPPSKLKRPVLGQQLEVMRTWPASLQSEDASPALKEYGARLAEQVEAADRAVTALAEAKRKLADFEVGARKQFIDKLNAARVLEYGQLAETALRQPELRLSRSFAFRFFLRSSGRRKATIADVERDILRLQERLRKQEELLVRMMEEEEAEARLREDAEITAAAAELEEAERKFAEAQQRLAAIREQRKSAE
jgi:hypothetical protein